MNRKINNTEQKKLSKLRKDANVRMSEFRDLMKKEFGEVIKVSDLDEDQYHILAKKMQSVISGDEVQSEPKPKLQPELQPMPELKSEPELGPEPEPELESVPESEPKSQSELSEKQKQNKKMHLKNVVFVISHPYYLHRMFPFMEEINKAGLYFCLIKLNFATSPSLYKNMPALQKVLFDAKDNFRNFNMFPEKYDVDIAIGDINSSNEMAKIIRAKKRLAIQLDERLDPVKAVRDQNFIDRYFVWGKPQKGDLKLHRIPVEKIRIIGSLWHTELAFRRNKFDRKRIHPVKRIVLIPPTHATPVRAFWRGTGILRTIHAMSARPDIYLPNGRRPNWTPSEVDNIYNEFMPYTIAHNKYLPSHVVLHHGESNSIMAAFKVPALHVKPSQKIRPSDFDAARPEEVPDRYINGSIFDHLKEELEAKVPK